MKKVCLLVLVLFVWAYAAQQVAAKNQTDKPNIIFVMIDDCSAVELSAYATAKHPSGNQTPVMDALAKEGLMFNTCWATPLCMPTRALLMSGKYGYQTSAYGNKVNTRNDNFAVDHKPISKVLKENGYETAISGKWHLSGFADDEAWGWDEYSLQGCYYHPKDDIVWDGLWFSWTKPAYTFPETAIIGKNNAKYPAMYWNGAVVENGKLLPSDATTYAPALCQKFSIDFIKRDHKNPFFLYYPIVLPHDPWMGTPDPNNPGQRTNPGFNSLIKQVEIYIDELISTLKKTGAYENSIVILTADNATLRNGKGNCSELGVRVPLIIAGGKLKKKGITNYLVDFSDFYPTIMDIAGIKAPKEPDLNGVSFYPLLEGKNQKEKEYIFSYLDMERTVRNKNYMMDGSGGIWECAADGNILDYAAMPENDATKKIRSEFMSIIEKYPLPTVEIFGKKKIEESTNKHKWPSPHPSMVKAISEQDEWMNNPRRLEE